MNLFSYILSHDAGFVPNPFGGFCTLACCKPKIRRTASLGDWVMGTAPSSNPKKLIYIMEVTRGLPFDLYFIDPLYQSKKPAPGNPYGDNIYRPAAPGKFEQVVNLSHDHRHIKKDLSTNRVLISDHFYYFGRNAPELPTKFARIIHSTQGHKRIRPNDGGHGLAQELIEWVESNFKRGLQGEPTLDEVICLPEEEDDDCEG